MLKFLSNWIVKNILGAIVFILALSIAVSIFLSSVTQHGKMTQVPDFTNMQVDEAASVAQSCGLRVLVSDSVYVRRMEKGAVFSQNPKPGTNVKNGRRVRLVTNARLAKKVTMPSLVGYSLRQAKAELSSKGLYLGRILYVDDMATNNVLKQIYRNSEIQAGRSIESGSTIDLMVGLSEEDCDTVIPDVSGMKYLRAVDAIQDNSLNVGKLIFDESVRNYSDSLNAVVLYQSPGSSFGTTRMGSEVSLTLTVNSDKISVR